MDAAILFGIILIPAVIGGAASLTGNGERLCAAMGGVYTPQASPGEVCPGGAWSNLFRARPA